MAPQRRPLVALLAPLVLLPLLSVTAPAPANRCLWATAIISSLWALEVLPLAVTSLLPLVLYPALVGAEDSRPPAADLTVGSTAVPSAAPSGPQLAGRSEMQAICRSLQEHNPQLVEQLRLDDAKLDRAFN